MRCNQFATVPPNHASHRQSSLTNKKAVTTALGGNPADETKGEGMSNGSNLSLSTATTPLCTNQTFCVNRDQHMPRVPGTPGGRAGEREKPHPRAGLAPLHPLADTQHLTAGQALGRQRKANGRHLPSFWRGSNAHAWGLMYANGSLARIASESVAFKSCSTSRWTSSRSRAAK